MDIGGAVDRATGFNVSSFIRKGSDHMKSLGFSVIEHSFDVSNSKRKCTYINHLNG